MKKIQLSNGLRVVMEQIPTCRSVSFGIWVKTGSRNESLDINGITHFIEHMMFKGTDRFDARAIAEQFDAIGGNVNAFTSKEYTCYYAKVLDEHLPIAVDVLSDMFFNSRLDSEELAKEKNVILEEIAMYEDTPDDLVHDLMSLSAYGDHPLAYPILGTKERLEAMDSDALRSYMNSHYTIENTVIALAGNIDDSVIELLERHFGAFKNNGSSQQLTVPAFQDGLIYHKKKTEQNHICLSFPGSSIGDELQYAMVLLNNAIGGGMSSRLFQEIREKRGLAYSVYSYHSSHADSGMFTIYAGTAPKQTKDVLELTKEILSDLAVKGMSEEELHKGKEQLKGSLILSLESTGSRMNRLGKNELMLGRHYSLDEMIQRIEQVNMEDVQKVINRMFETPFALAMVGSSDKALNKIRRDEFVALRSN
ncbi:Predicted Zn-dependent peptidase [Paenibacillus uliginis N3/975]|uniref:Predicted Zn-dependent peptidase n=1 Tax=Paenibacillus uliginis N3/975 TaxID=1313296 RepID=A0A1X7H8Z4_9BACL|nr:pitrilysin family protein [Paenibacillus uliginis]SMF81886.1 Predicted Zn-dependent peptidase [Paenibacillus uliginis N3/975]